MTNKVNEYQQEIEENVLNSLKNASPKIRLAVLLHDVGKLKTMEQRKSFFGSKELVDSIVDKNIGINGLGYSKKEVKNIVKIIHGYDFNNWCLATRKTIKKFIFDNYEVVESIIEIKNVVKNESRVYTRNIRSAEILRKVYNDMIKNGSPFYLADLKIKGDDIIKDNPNINLENLDVLLENLLEYAAINPKKNNKQDLLVAAKQKINSKRDFYLE